MRKLPIYFLIDVSESMVGRPLKQVETGLSHIVKSLKTDPYALETVHLSVIAFAGKAKVVSPLAELFSYYPPMLPLGRGTSLGTGLSLLMKDLEFNVKKRTSSYRGDWKPIVYLFTDGRPTDECEGALHRWEQSYRDKVNLVVVSIGDNVEVNLLSRLTDTVLEFNNTSPEEYQKFFKWITNSIKSQSVKVETTGEDQLFVNELEGSGARRIDLSKGRKSVMDDQVAVIEARCQSTGGKYLIKYNRYVEPSIFKGMGVDVTGFALEGAFEVDENTLDEFSETEKLQLTVNTEDLRGFPHCPCCGNEIGFALCSCGEIMCASPEKQVQTCPNCHKESYFGYSEGHVDINRTLG
ncbi:MAG: VWA domain-containing protein [Cytophagales bacterium]|nr:VWA domain-containing protein [Cytophagales bacterium]